MLTVFFTTSAVVADVTRHEDDIVPFEMGKTWDEGTAEDVSNIDERIGSNRKAGETRRRRMYLIKAGREPLPNLKRFFEVHRLSKDPKYTFTSRPKYFAYLRDSHLDQGASDRVRT